LPLFGEVALKGLNNLIIHFEKFKRKYQFLILNRQKYLLLKNLNQLKII